MTQTSRPSNCSCSPPPVWTRGALKGRESWRGRYRWEGREGERRREYAPKVPPATDLGPLGEMAPQALAVPLQILKAFLVAPPKTSTSLSSQGRALPSSGPEQLAIPWIWAGVRMWSHRLNWAMSPTKA